MTEPAYPGIMARIQRLLRRPQPVTSATTAQPARRGMIAIIDQGAVSGVNFLTALVLARYLSLTDFGHYALVFTVLLLINAIQSAIITGPLMVMVPRYEQHRAQAYLSSLWLIQLVFCVIALLGIALLHLAIAHWAPDLVPDASMIAILLAIATYLGQEFLRRTLFALQDSTGGLLSDLVSYGLQLVVIVLLIAGQQLTLEHVFWAMALTSLLGCVVAAVRMRLTLHGIGRQVLGDAWQQNWRYGRWLFGSAVSSWGSSQVYFIIVAALLSPEATALMAASRNILGVTHIFLLGLENFVPTTLTHVLLKEGVDAMKRWLQRFTLIGAFLMGAYCLAAVVFADPLMQLLFGPQYANTAMVVAIISLSYFISFFYRPPMIALRVLGAPRSIFVANLIAALVTIVVAGGLVSYGGINGAAIGLVVTQLVILLVSQIALRRAFAQQSDAVHGNQAAVVASPANDRFFTWRVLLPETARIDMWNVPQAFRVNAGNVEDQPATAWLGWQARRTDLPVLEAYQAIVLVNPQGIDRSWLAARGFAHIRSFAVIPNMTTARLYIPLESRQAALHAWAMHTPFRWQTWLRKISAQLLIQVPIGLYVGDRLMIAQRSRSPIEQEIARITDADISHVALMRSGKRRKITMQILNAAGDVTAYVKYAHHADDRRFVEQEARLHAHVEGIGLQSILIPRLRCHAPYLDGYLLVSEPLGGQLRGSGLHLRRQHLAALHELQQQRGACSNGEDLAALQQNINQIRHAISDVWYTRLCRGIAAARSVAGMTQLPTVLSHGDFTPWNIQIGSDTSRIVLLDWENGALDRPLLWDAFHFKTQVELLLRHGRHADRLVGLPRDPAILDLARAFCLTPQQICGLYQIYLVDAGVQWLNDYWLHYDGDAVDTSLYEARGRVLDQITATGVAETLARSHAV
ncbi:MAG TPA: oligosaccharide flippase family protein [Roseiflexaceae bacterium]|nr:oligosaccharide flippase family protein [Roseiflexaceae bacterium]